MNHIHATPQPSENEYLQKRIRKVEAENHRLRAEVEFLRCNPTIAKGLKGESLIAKLISAKHSKRGANHDLESHGNPLLFEVKYSSLLNTISGRPIKRWVWTKLFGEQGKKNYHRLLLVGDADPRFAATYADPTSPYVIFDLPYEAVIELTGGIKPGRSSRIHLTSNPTSVTSSRASTLFQVFQISALELQHRYPNLEPVEPK